jgi:hypothetical protein
MSPHVEPLRLKLGAGYCCSWHSPQDGARLVVSRAKGRNRELRCSAANGGSHG